MGRIKHPANILRGSRAITPIQRFKDWSDHLATATMFGRARAEKRTKPQIPEPPRVNVPNISGVHAGGSLKGGSINPPSNTKAL